MDNPIGKPLKVQYRHEIEKLRKMTFKEKIKYIWEYYRIHIVVLVIIFSVIGSLINVWFINPPAEPVLTIAWSSGFIMDEQLRDLEDILAEQLADEAENESVDVISLLTGGDDPQMHMAYVTRLMAMVAARQIDIFVLDSEMLTDHSNSGLIQPMESILSEIQAANPAVYALIEERIVYITYEIEEEGPQENIMAIDVMGSPLFRKLDMASGFFGAEAYFSVAVTTERHENVVNTLIMFFE